MRILVCIFFIILAYINGTYQHNNEYLPTNIDLPPILRKYEFEVPDMFYHPRELPVDDDTSEDTDYENAQQIDRLLNYRREYAGWLASNDQSSVSDDNICESKVCREEAENIKNNIDFNNDPCDDFDQFACGGWREIYPIPKSRSSMTVFIKLWRDEEEILKKLIEKQLDKPDNSSASLLHSWYASCMNKKEISDLGATPLVQLINTFDSCPLLKPSWESYTWSFIDHLVALNKIGINPFFSILPGIDRYNSNKKLLHLSPSELPLHSLSIYLQPGQYYKTVRHGYFRLMIKLMLKLSPYGNPELIKKHIFNIYKMDALLARTRINGSFSYQKMTLNRLQAEIPKFPWKRYLFKLYSNIPQNKTINGDEIIAVSNIKILKKIVSVLTERTKSEGANYLIWNIVHSFANDLSPDFDEIFDEFVAAMYGKRERKLRWRECVASTSSALSMAVGKLFVEQMFDVKRKEKAAKIIENIRDQLIKDFKEILWMDSHTSGKAEEKANAIVKNIGYPEFILNDTLLQHYYTGLSFHPRQFFNNIIYRRIVITKNTLKSREYKPYRQGWSLSPQEINAYYSPAYNKIVFPAGILQPPFWHSGFPMSLQFAGLGFIAGHEMSHGFDSTGMYFDKNGNYFNWWTDSSFKSYTLKTHCLQDQYSNYTIFGKNINGDLTLCENIADNGGLRLAYKAYKDWVGKNGADKRLPGLPFNDDQLFFVKVAQIWCANIRKKSTLNTIDTDEHTPKMFRTIGSLSNFMEFSKAFNCPVGSKMNPVNKCRVW